jgi:DNA-binding MarR family transcriptional regulator
MERAGLVERASCSSDGRGVEALLTDLGYARLQEAAPTHVRGVREYLVDLASPDDFEAVGRVFNAVTDRLVDANPAVDIR